VRVEEVRVVTAACQECSVAFWRGSARRRRRPRPPGTGFERLRFVAQCLGENGDRVIGFSGRHQQQRNTACHIATRRSRLATQGIAAADRVRHGLSLPCVTRRQATTTGRHSQPRTVELVAILALSASTSHSGKRVRSSSSAILPSKRASAARGRNGHHVRTSVAYRCHV